MPRALHLQINTSLNGYMCRPDNTLDFLVPFSDDLNQYVESLITRIDDILMGRKLAEGFIAHWRSNPAHEKQSTTDTFNNMKKTVFTKTLIESPWDSTVELASGELVEKVRRMKTEEAGKGLIVYGGCEFVESLVEADLIDEFHIIVHPIAVPDGKKAFTTEAKLDLVKAQAFACGAAVMHYRRLA